MSFKPEILALNSIHRDGKTITVMKMAVAPGVEMSFASVVLDRDVERAIRSGMIPASEVGGIFGDIWKGIKKVGKAIGVDKVIKVAKGVLKNPVVNAIFPPTLAARAGLQVAEGLATAAFAKKKGHPKANKALAIAVATAKKAGLTRDEVAVASRNADKIYQLIVRPM